MSRSELHNGFNITFLYSASVFALWFSIRESVSNPSGLRTLFEWFALIALPFLVPFLVRLIKLPIWLVAFGALALFGRMALEQPFWSAAPMYWTGFGRNVASIALTTVLVFCLFSWWIATRSERSRKFTRSRHLSNARVVVASIAVLWLLPSILQPMDAWLNIGDASQIVLEEIAGWANFHVPGFHQAAVYSSMLGLPLLPLSLLKGFSDEKIVLIVLYVNLLVLLVPITVAAILRKLQPKLLRIEAFAASLIAVSMSGAMTDGHFMSANTSLFRELSFLSRGLLPLVLGYLLVTTFSRRANSLKSLSLFAFLCSITALNNFEFGFGAVLAAVVTFFIVGSSYTDNLKKALRLVFGIFLCLFAFIVLGGLSGGKWFEYRLGAFNVLVSGESKNLHQGLGIISAFGFVPISFALAVACLVIGLQFARIETQNDHQRQVATTLVYFSCWTIFAAPYYLNAGSLGGPGAQFYLPTFLILVTAMAGISNKKFLGDAKPKLRKFNKHLVPSIPLMFAIGICIGAVTQAPNGLREWRRVQLPVAQTKWVDEWSPHNLDFIDVSMVTSIANSWGGPENVGWWWQHGSAIEILTGVENLVGVTGFETVRSASMLELACDPLVRSKKIYVISFQTLGSVMNRCEGLSATQVSELYDFNFVVYEIERDMSR